MIALLAIQGGVHVAEAVESLQRKRVIGAFRLLQADQVGPRRLDVAVTRLDAQADRIDVPGRQREWHRQALRPTVMIVQL